MTKKECSFRWVIAGVFAAVCFTFFHWFYPNHLFMKEQMRIFLYTTEYFISFWDEPAWLSCYVGNFFTQFYCLSGVGPLVITLILLLMWYVFMQILRKFGGGNMVAIYAMLPVALEWGLLCRLTYSITSTLSLIFVLILFLGYIKVKEKRLSVVIAFILLPIIYGMLGSRLFIFSLMIIFYEGIKSRKRWWFWLLLLVSSYLYPYFMRHYYELSIEDAYKYSYVDGFSVYFPAMLFFLEVVFLQVRSVRRIRLNKQILCASVILLFVLLGTVLLNANLKREKILALDHAVYLKDWERVIALSENFHSPDLLVSYYRNIALAGKDQLPDQLLDHYQFGSDALFLPADLMASMLPFFFSNEVYFQIGDMDMAHQRVMEGIMFTPKQRSGRLIKRLAEIELQKRDTLEALKYINVLGATFSYRQWAVKQKRLLIGEDTFKDNYLPRKKDWEYDRSAGEAVSDYPDKLRVLVEKHPKNKKTLDYLLCYYLLDKKLNAFKDAFDAYYKGHFSVVPRLYSEALLQQQFLLNSSDVLIAEYRIPDDIRKNYNEYRQARIGEKTKEELREHYSSHYWYYFDYEGNGF